MLLAIARRAWGFANFVIVVSQSQKMSLQTGRSAYNVIIGCL